MKRLLYIALCCLVSFTPGAKAASFRYLEDPVYVKLNKDDPLPMEDLMTLASDGDARAQYILGDLYSKGKGGLARNRVKAYYWFEISARHGYTPAFIRLAALAKHNRDYILACQWYALDADHSGGKEAAWSKSELQRLSKSLSPDAFHEAKQDAKDWLKRQREAMSVILKDEKTSRETLPPPDLGDDDDEKGKDKDKDKSKDTVKDKKAARDEKTAVKEPETPRKEFHYND
jgi:TPR repeat protein